MTGVSRALLGRPGGEKLIAPTVRLFLSAPRYSVHRWTLVRRPSPLAAVTEDRCNRRAGCHLSDSRSAVPQDGPVTIYNLRSALRSAFYTFRITHGGAESGGG